MIKVDNIKTIPLIKNLIGGNAIPTLVTDAKLVLVECKEVKHAILHNIINRDGKFYKPILISETEKIEDGDWALTEYGLLHKVEYTNHNLIGWKKVLALPEHFSPEQLQMIVDGKLKDGDKVLVECENKPVFVNGEEFFDYQIKLNPHITITI